MFLLLRIFNFWHIMTTKERLQEYLKFKGVSPTSAERTLGWGVGAFTKAKSITADRAQEFLLFFSDLSAEWLMRGEGEMIRKAQNATLDIDRIATLVDTITTLQDTINEKNKTIATLQAQLDRYEKSVVK